MFWSRKLLTRPLHENEMISTRQEAIGYLNKKSISSYPVPPAMFYSNTSPILGPFHEFISQTLTDPSSPVVMMNSSSGAGATALPAGLRAHATWLTSKTP